MTRKGFIALSLLVLCSGTIYSASAQQRLAIISESGLMEGPRREYDLFTALTPVALQEAATPMIVSKVIVKSYLSRNVAMRAKRGLTDLVDTYQYCLEREAQGVDYADLYDAMCAAEQRFNEANGDDTPREHLEYGLVAIDFSQWRIFRYKDWFLFIPQSRQEALCGFNTAMMTEITSMYRLGQSVKPDIKSAFTLSKSSRFHGVIDDLRFVNHIAHRDCQNFWKKVMGAKMVLDPSRPNSLHVDTRSLKEMILPGGQWNIMLIGHGLPTRSKYLAKNEQDPWAQLAGLTLGQAKDLLSFFNDIGTRTLSMFTCFAGGYHSQLLHNWCSELESSQQGMNFPVLTDTHTDCISRPPARQVGAMRFKQPLDQFLFLDKYFAAIEQASVVDEGVLRVATQWVADRRLERDVRRLEEGKWRREVGLLRNSCSDSHCPCHAVRQEPSNLPLIRMPGASGFSPLGDQMQVATSETDPCVVDDHIRVVRLEVPKLAKLVLPSMVYPCGTEQKLSSLVSASVGRAQMKIGSISFDPHTGADVPDFGRFWHESILPIPSVYSKRISIGSLFCMKGDFGCGLVEGDANQVIELKNIEIIKNGAEERAYGRVVCQYQDDYYLRRRVNFKSGDHNFVKISKERYDQEVAKMDQAIAPAQFWRDPLTAILMG